ncbi:hypothetical protein HK103_004189 [Boothiomyces macroporosus]|uniref:Uncharacterized protein n=1 Tax=Boothiomyces macroporosus TaxID=261099 RepID=A0AAD5UHK3_9FUNG|nr:hypothetical protein HK103_004189 [Boothiomyces macroporosus]
MGESVEEKAARLALEKYINDKPNDSGLREIVEQCKPHLTFVEICGQLNIPINDTPKQKKRTYIRPYASPQFVGMPVSAEPEIIPARQSPLRKRLDFKDQDQEKDVEIILPDDIEKLAQKRVEEFILIQPEESGIRDVVEKCKPHFTFLEICEQLEIDVADLLEMRETEAHAPVPSISPKESDKQPEMTVPDTSFENTELENITHERNTIDDPLLDINSLKKWDSKFVNAVFNGINGLDKLLPTSFHQFFYDMLLHTALVVDPTAIHSDLPALEKLYPSNVDGIDQLTNFKIRKLCEDIIFDVKTTFLAKPLSRDASTMTAATKYTSKATGTTDLIKNRSTGVNTDKLKTHEVSTSTSRKKIQEIGTNTEQKEFTSRATATGRNDFSKSIAVNTESTWNSDTVKTLAILPEPVQKEHDAYSQPSSETNQKVVEPIRKREGSNESAPKRLKTDTDGKSINLTMKVQQGNILKDIQAKIHSDTKNNSIRQNSVQNSNINKVKNNSNVSVRQESTPDARTVPVKKVDAQIENTSLKRTSAPVVLETPAPKPVKSAFAIDQERYIHSIKADIQRSIKNDERRHLLMRKFANTMEEDYSEEGEIQYEENNMEDYPTFDAETLAKAKVLKALAK